MTEAWCCYAACSVMVSCNKAFCTLFNLLCVPPRVGVQWRAQHIESEAAHVLQFPRMEFDVRKFYFSLDA